MSTATFLVGDVFERLAEIPDSSVDLVLTSPPFLALRSYLPADHPDKAKEIGSEATPVEFLDTLLALTAEWGRVLAPHGSIAVELGDTYAGSGGAGGDYTADGLRSGQPVFGGSARAGRLANHSDHRGNPDGMRDTTFSGANTRNGGGAGWPMEKSLCGIPQAYQLSLAYGRNILTGEPSPAGFWRVRTVKPWIRSNPPVGALGDKERPATSYVIVATRARDRYFDLDAVRTQALDADPRSTNGQKVDGRDGVARFDQRVGSSPAGAPPRDWWHHVDAVLDACLDAMAGRTSRGSTKAYAAGANSGRRSWWPGGDQDHPEPHDGGAETVGARGVHLRRALEAAGILTTLEALDVSAKGYSGAHYAVWPPELVRLLVEEMCPRRVCTTCGEPSRRMVEAEPSPLRPEDRVQRTDGDAGRSSVRPNGKSHIGITRKAATLGWSDCGHDTWRPGHVLDPFGGSGTTGMVATGLARNCTLIDLDPRNVDLARERVGMFLEVHDREQVTS